MPRLDARTLTLLKETQAEGLAGGDSAPAVSAPRADLPPKILNMTTPHVGHLPLIALRPFFIVSSTALAISFLALHLTQYPSGIEILSRRPRTPLCTHRFTQIKADLV